MAPAAGFALAATQRVVDGVHGDAADARALAPPAIATGLAPGNQFVLGVAHFAHRGLARRVHQPDLPRRHAEGGLARLLGQQLHAGAGGSSHLGAGAGLQLDRVHGGTHRDVDQRKRVARANVGPRAGNQAVAHTQALRSQDVTLLAVGVVQQSDPRGAIGIVFDVRDLRRNAVLVPPEVDHPVLALVPAALVPRGDPAVDVSPGALAHRARERLLGGVAGDLLEVGDARAAAAGSGRLVLPDGHRYGPFASKISMESPPGASRRRASD